MARSALTVQQIVPTGLAPSYAAPDAAGSIIPGSGDIFLHVKNTGVQTTVTVQTPLQVAGLDLAENPVIVPATTGDRMIGPFSPVAYNRAVGAADAGYVYVDYTSVAGVTVACLRLGAA
jgi:hypothetical protein